MHPPARSDPVAEDAAALLARYKLIRDEISREDSPMSARLSWFMASTSWPPG